MYTLSNIVPRRFNIIRPFLKSNIYKWSSQYSVLRPHKKFNYFLVDDYYSHIFRPFMKTISRVARVPFGVVNQRVDLLFKLPDFRNIFIDRKITSFRLKNKKIFSLRNKVISNYWKLKLKVRAKYSVLLGSAINMEKANKFYFRNRSIFSFIKKSMRQPLLKKEAFRFLNQLLKDLKMNQRMKEKFMNRKFKLKVNKKKLYYRNGFCR